MAGRSSVGWAGKAIYNRPTAQGGCSGCHGIRPGKIPEAWATPLVDAGSDTKEWDILKWQANPGVLTGALIPILAPVPLKDPDLAFNVLATSVLGSIVQHAISPSATAQETQGINPELAALPPALQDLKGAFHLPGQPGPSSKQTAQIPQPIVPVFDARVLEGIWAAAPYLHNGSVPTLYDLLPPVDLLLPADQRPKAFKIGPA